MKNKVLYLIIAVICVIMLTACEESKPVEQKAQNPGSGSVITAVNNSQKSGEIVISEKSGEEAIENNQEEIIESKPEEKKEQPKEEASAKNNGYTIIKFSDMYETKGNIKNVSTMLKNLNGKKVEIKGYPAVQSPLDESFVYLMNQPFVTCPFCTIGDTTKLEVIPIFMANKSKIKYTENALDVFGTLEVAAKVDSEGYTTQFRIYADKIKEVEDTNANKAVNAYYADLSEKGMIYDIQTLQMNIEYVSNPLYMVNYDEKVSTGQSSTLDKIAMVKAISDEYLSYDSQYGTGFGTDFTYLHYVKECPEIVKDCEPKDERLIKLNNELIKLYNDEIGILEKYQEICYKIHALGDNITEKEAEGFADELTKLNGPNMKQYEAFTAWNNKLRE